MPLPWDEPLPPGISLRVWQQVASGSPSVVFESSGKWLHPLFELTEFLASEGALVPEPVALRDRIIGRAAAFLIVRLGIRQVIGEVMSSRAVSLFQSAGTAWQSPAVVPRIDCQTEDQLAEVTDSDLAWRLLSERRRRAQTS